MRSIQTRYYHHQLLKDPDVFGRLQAGAQNFTTGGNPIAGLLNAVQGLTTGTRTDPTGIALAQQQITANAVFKHLVTVEKMAPSQAATVAQMLALQPDLMKEYFKPPATAEAAAVRNVFGGQAGGGIQGALDYQAASTRTKTMAQEQAKNAVQFPDIAANADNMISMIDQLKAHPGKDLATGPVLGRAPAIGGAQADFIARHEQVLAEGMGQFIASVRGSNLRITQGEIMQGQKAINRANRLLGTDAYNAALDDVRHWVERIRTNAGTKAGLGPTPTQVQPPAAPPSQADLQAEARRRGLIQ